MQTQSISVSAAGATALNRVLSVFNAKPTTELSPHNLPASFRSNLAPYWMGYMQLGAISLLNVADRGHTVANYLLGFCHAARRMGKRLFTVNHPCDPKSLSRQLVSDVLAKQASILSNLLVRSKFPRKMLMVKNVLTGIDIAGFDLDLGVASGFMVSGLVTYKYKKSALTLSQFVGTIRGGLYSAGFPRVLAFPPKALTAETLATFNPAHSPCWLNIFNRFGVSLSVARSSDNCIVFSYTIAVEGVLFFDQQDIESSARRVLTLLWKNSFSPP